MPTDSSNLPKAEWNIPDSNILIIDMGFLTKTGMNCFFGTKQRLVPKQWHQQLLKHVFFSAEYGFWERLGTQQHHQHQLGTSACCLTSATSHMVPWGWWAYGGQI